MMDQPDVRYCMADDGVRLAYYVIGEGPPLVRASGFPSHLTGNWAMPGAADGTRRLAEEHKVVSYDPRGMGLSQRVLDFSLDTRVADLRAIVRHLGLERFALFGGGHATPLALAYAARFPEAVTHLVLSAPYADGPQLYATSPAFSAYAALESVTLDQWDFVTNTIAHRFAGYRDVASANEMAKLIQASISAEGYVAYRRDNRLTSVTAELSGITSPTLVVATENDEVIPTELSQEVAARIPNARFHLNATGFSSQDTLAPGARSAFYLNEATTDLVLDFLRPEGAARPAARDALTPQPPLPQGARGGRGGTQTVLFTDNVGHTEMMRRLGDEGGREVLRDHERLTRETLKAHGGAEVKTMGDGFMASFASVTKAMDCAIALQRAFAAHTESMPEPLHVRVGLNAGEPIEEDGDLFGSTVIMASRIAAKAGAGEILIPETLRHLLTGKSFIYADRGETMLKGFEEAVRLYEVRWRE